MGNCQAVDAASLVVQHPNGKVDKLYWPVSASHVMKLNPGHYVALLITTTTISNSNSPVKPSHNAKNSNSPADSANNSNSPVKPSDCAKNNNSPVKPSDSAKNSNSPVKPSDSAKNITSRNAVRITRVKLLRPKDTLALGHVYRLISAQEVMKGLVAKKQAKMKKNGIELADSEGLKEAEKLVKLTLQDKTHLVSSRHGQRSSRTTASSGTNRPKTWQPSLNSISEAAS